MRHAVTGKSETVGSKFCVCLCVLTDKRFAEEPCFIPSFNVHIMRFVHLQWGTGVTASICNETDRDQKRINALRVRISDILVLVLLHVKISKDRNCSLSDKTTNYPILL
jgi:hypothetical protein